MAKETSGRCAGNFELGDCFADVRCRFGHKTRLFNLHRVHYVACDECSSFILVGSNLTSCWRQESEHIWRKNYDSVKGYNFVR
jgi:hypothetical protein